MVTQLKVIQGDRNKGKTHSKIHQAAKELDYLIIFNRSITQAMARTMQDLSEGIFINVANLSLTCRDSYLDYIKSGIKQDTLTALKDCSPPYECLVSQPFDLQGRGGDMSPQGQMYSQLIS